MKLLVSDDSSLHRRMLKSLLEKRGYQVVLASNGYEAQRILDGNPTYIYGRIRDISEDGVGAMIPCSLFISEQVTLVFSMGDGREGTMSAIVRHCHGFLYGFEFISIEP